MRTAAVIVAGGRSSRMGREKALEVIGGQTIIGRIAGTLRPQVDELVINANGDAARFAATGLSVIPDLMPVVGTPLAGLHAALKFAEAHGFDAVLTVPSDSPFIPSNLTQTLGAVSHQAAVAMSGGQTHYLTGLWSPMLLPGLEVVLHRRPLPRLQDWVQQCHAAEVEWPTAPYDPFFNVNTPEQLAQARQIAAKFSL